MRIAITAALVAAVAAGAVSCRHRHPDPEDVRKMVTWQVGDTLDELDATPDQRTVVLAAKDRILERMLAGMLEHHRTAAVLLAEWEKDSPDKERVRTILESQLEQRRQALLAGLDDVYEVHTALTPEQRAQVAERIRERLAD